VDEGRSGAVAMVAAGLLLLVGVEYATHDVRDDYSYRAGYSAASHVPVVQPGAFTDAGSGVAMCDGLLADALDDAGSTALNGGDFRAGCTQAVRDAIE